MMDKIDLGIMDVNEPEDNTCDEGSIVVFDGNSDKNIQQAMSELGIETDLTVEELFDVGIASNNKAAYHSVRAGVAFIAAQKGLEQQAGKNRLRQSQSAINATEKEQVRQSHSTFLAWINDRGLSERRVYESIGIAKAYMAIPPEQRQKFIALGKYKVVKFASIEPEVIKEIAEQEPDKLDEFALMSRAEMKAEINRLKKRVSTQDVELDLKSKSISKLQNRCRMTDFTQETEDVRAECLVLQAECELPVNALVKLFNANLDSSETEYWDRMGQIWITAHAICARAVDLIANMKAMLDEENLPKRIQTEHTLLPNEAERWILDYKRIVETHENARYERQKKREEAAPRGRGRPRKIQ